MVKLIVAVGKNGEIGRGNNLPWRIKKEMDHFVQKTSGHVVVMGMKTWESLGRKPLKNRINYVLTRDTSQNELTIGTFVINSLDEILNIDDFNGARDVFIIGGQSIYNQTLKLGMVDEIYLTEVDLEITDADAFLYLPNEKMSLIHDYGNFKDLDKITGTPVDFSIKHYKLSK